MPEPAVDRLVSMPLPSSRLIVQNLEADREIDADVELRKADGTVAARFLLTGIPPLSPRVLEIDELPELETGIYGANVNGTGRLAAVARHSLPFDDEAGHETQAIATASEPGLDLILPYVEITDSHRSAVLSIQSTDTSSAAEVDIALVPFGAEGALPAWQGRIALPAGGSVSLDLARPGFEALAGSFSGFARITADVPIAASVLIVRPNRYGQAMAALEAVPKTRSEPQLFTYFATEFVSFFPNRPASTLAVVNPLAVDATVRLTYDLDTDTGCGPSTSPGPTRLLPANSGILIEHNTALAPELTEDCIGIVQIESDAGALVAATLAFGGEGSGDWQPATALRAQAGTAGRMAIPWLAWLDHMGSWAQASVINPTDQIVTTRLGLRDEQGDAIPIPGSFKHEIQAQPRSFTGWYAAGGQDFTGIAAGVVDHDTELIGIGSSGTEYGGAVYPAIAIDSAETSAHVPFLARPAHWSTPPVNQTQSPNPTATPLRITVMPPTPRPDPTLEPPIRQHSVAMETSEDWLACCTSLTWTQGGDLWGVEFGDGVPIDLSRFALPSGRWLGHPARGRYASRIRAAADGTLYALESRFRDAGQIQTFDPDGRPTGLLQLPIPGETDLRDLAPAPDGTIWLIDNLTSEVHHISASGDRLETWSFSGAIDALAAPDDSGHRIAISPDGSSIYVLTWTRLLRFSPEGRLLGSVGALRLELGPKDAHAPMDLSIDASGRAYVLDGTGQLQVFEPDGWRVAEWQAFDNPPDSSGWAETALALGPDGHIAVADLSAERVHIYAPLRREPAARPTRGPHQITLPWLEASDGR